MLWQDNMYGLGETLTQMFPFFSNSEGEKHFWNDQSMCRKKMHSQSKPPKS